MVPPRAKAHWQGDAHITAFPPGMNAEEMAPGPASGYQCTRNQQQSQVIPTAGVHDRLCGELLAIPAGGPAARALFVEPLCPIILAQVGGADL